MKRIMVLLMVLLAVSSTALANDEYASVGAKLVEDVVFEGGCGEDCVQIKTRNNVFRIYACGKIEKKVWEELNPNEDTITAGAYLGLNTEDYTTPDTRSNE